MPSNLRKSRLPLLSLVPVITREVEVDPDGRYEGLPHFSHFGDQIKFVGGVNRPKLIQARCFAQGKRKKQNRRLTLCMSTLDSSYQGALYRDARKGSARARNTVGTGRQVFDSDGRRYRQLVKSGNDDMRQDAVMQQFFQLVNVLLAADPATRRRQLHIVMYKVKTLVGVSATGSLVVVMTAVLHWDQNYS